MPIAAADPNKPPQDLAKATAAINAYVAANTTGQLATYVASHDVKVKLVKSQPFMTNPAGWRISIALENGPADRACILFVDQNWNLINQPGACSCDS